MNREIGGLQDMYRRNCGKSRTNTKPCECCSALPVRRAKKEGWEFRSYMTSRFNVGCKPVCWRYTKTSPRLRVLGLLWNRRQFCKSTVFLVAVPRRDIKILSSDGFLEWPSQDSF